MMISSEKTDLLQEALAKANAKFEPVQEKGVVKFNNVNFNYAQLSDIISMLRPKLAAEGLSMMQNAFVDGKEAVVKTRLNHASGQFIESDALRLPVASLDPKVIGAALTYARRYSLSAFFSISGDAVDLDQLHGFEENKQQQRQPQAAQPKKAAPDNEEIKRRNQILNEIGQLVKLHGKDKISEHLGLPPERLNEIKGWGTVQISAARDILHKRLSSQIVPEIEQPQLTQENETYA